MNFTNLRHKLSTTIPPSFTHTLSKTLSHTVQGYIFGTMVGIITNDNKKFLRCVNNTGLKFAKVGFVYSAIDSATEGVYGKSKYNATVTGVLTGFLVGKNRVASGVGLGMYSALVDFYNTKEGME